MKEIVSIAATLGLILAVTLFLNILEKSGERIAPADKPGPAEPQPDVQIRNATILKTDDFGYHKYHLHADRVEHYLQRSTELENLRLMVSSSGNDTDWLLTAEAGWMDESSKQLLLHGEVLVNQRKEGSPDITGLTRDMLVDYAKTLAYSSAPATLLNGQNMTSGTGLAINFSRPGKISLLSRVSGTHVFE
jgi:LPS export ABC transporter protein LptC